MHFYFPVPWHIAVKVSHPITWTKGLLSLTPYPLPQIINDDFWNAHQSFSRFTVSSGTKNKWTQAPYHGLQTSLGPIYLSVLIPITITHSFTRCQSQRPFYPNGTPNSCPSTLLYKSLWGLYFSKFSNGRLLPSSPPAFLLKGALKPSKFRQDTISSSWSICFRAVVPHLWAQNLQSHCLDSRVQLFSS